MDSALISKCRRKYSRFSLRPNRQCPAFPCGPQPRRDLVGHHLHVVRGGHDRTHTLEALAQALLNDNQFDEALKQYKELADADPENAEALIRIGEIQRRQGKYEDALGTIRKALKLDSMKQDSTSSKTELRSNRALCNDIWIVSLPSSCARRGAAFRMQRLQKRWAFPTPHCTASSGERHHLTLNKLETILDKLKAKLGDVFPDEF